MKTHHMALWAAGLTLALVIYAKKKSAAAPSTTEVTPGTLNPGQQGYGWRYFSDGTAIDPQGNYYSGGTMIYSPPALQIDPAQISTVNGVPN